MDWGDGLRIINALGCGIALGLLAGAAHQHWRSWNRKTIHHVAVLGAWLFLGFEATIENIIFQTQPGPRTVIQTLVLTWTLRVLTRTGKVDEEFYINDKNNKETT